ncbi:MAG: hypothetical protein JSV97_09785 [candidate division WOR-3 bacterium]|nr:MAG: hypothetical protein JSV97_09785 [candidate division WOR-3 bacterium]
MKRLLLLLFVAIPLFAAGVHFIYYDYGYDDYGSWYDEYWQDEYWYDGYWVYYPHGYYCIHFVWWYPWWWDWYWWRCHWHHHFHWDFFYRGFYIVWYEFGYWWFRPRYGRWVRYRVPYAYHEIRYRAQSHGIHLPDKPPREIVVPYKEREIRELIRQKDPELFTRVEKEHKSGTLERKRIDYTTQVQKEIEKKNRDYGIKSTPKDYTKMTGNRQPVYKTPTKQVDTREKKAPYVQPEQKSVSRIQRREKEQKTIKNIPSKKYDDDEKQKIEKKPTINKSKSDRYDDKEKDAYRSKRSEPSKSQREKQTVDKLKKMNKPSSEKTR